MKCILASALDGDDDRDLIRSWRRGDESAGQRLFARHFGAVYRFFRNKANRDCEELVQRTFRTILEKGDELGEIANFRAYVFAVARLELLQLFRRHDRAGRLVDFNETSVVELDPTPSEYLGAKQELRLLNEALRRIPLDLQIVIELSYWEEMSMADIGHVLGIPSGTAKSRLHRARTLLRAAMEDLTRDAQLLHSTIDGFDGWMVAVRQQLERDTDERD